MPDRTPLASMPSFEAFYHAINGHDPFPWQRRLATEVARTERWPVEVGVPTGLGKTACLDIAVWWLASQAKRAPMSRTAPTRIWWVVNRRLLVDGATEHAKAISEALRDPLGQNRPGPSADIVAVVAARLRSLSADVAGTPLEVIRLRGGIASGRPTDPAKPAVLLSTLPMYGSRLLFRGYGSSRSMRPVDAALAGTDSLVLLDEAHLAPHLRDLVPALAECTPGAREILGTARSRPRVVALTATGDASRGGRFDLDAEDAAHPEVRRRLDALKPTEVRVMASGDSASQLTEATLGLIREAPAPATCVVFANTPATARRVFEKLVASGAEEVVLLTGRTREREAERTRSRILDPVHGMAARRPVGNGRQRHLIAVATQTLEVGADIDAEYLVTEACGVRALTQRLGRLNRLGRHAHARAVYVHLPSQTGRAAAGVWPVYGSEPARVLMRLERARDSETNTVNLSPRRIAEILGDPEDDPGRAPEVLQGILWEWTKTTTPPADEAPVEPYFSGIAGAEYRVSLLWRAHIPGEGESLWPRATDREAVEVPIVEVRDALGEDEDLRRVGADGATVERVSGKDLRPADTVVLPCDRGLLDPFGWAPASGSSVVDMSLAGHGLPLDTGALRRLYRDLYRNLSVEEPIDTALGVGCDTEDIDATKQATAVEQILTALAVTPPGWEPAEWNDVLDLRKHVVTAQNEVPRLPARTVVRSPRIDSLDEGSLVPVAVNLDVHCEAVAVRARTIAECLGMAADLSGAVECAGRLHDIGKADRRFQRWLDPDGQDDGVPIAKSNMPRHRWNAARAAAGWPGGGRHEALSARLVQRWLESRSDIGELPAQDLLLHLIITHHGNGRPLVLPVANDTAETVSAVIAGASVEVPANLSDVDWDQPGRFWRLSEQFSPWGLALLEAIVRQADIAVSAGSDGRAREVH